MDEMFDQLVEALRALVSYRAQPMQLVKYSVFFTVFGVTLPVIQDADDKKIAGQMLRVGKQLAKELKAQVDNVEQPFRFFKGEKLASPEKVGEALSILFGYEFGWESADLRRYRVMTLLGHRAVDAGTWKKAGGPQSELLEHLANHLLQSRNEEAA